MPKHAIYLYNACERFNFGDLLYQHIVKEKLCNKLKYSVDFYVVGIVYKDMTQHGGAKCITINDMLNIRHRYNKNTLIVGGGQILGSSYEILKSFINIRKNDVIHDFFKIPYIVDDNTILEEFDVLYMSVAGNVTRFKNYKHHIDNLSKSNYMCVRDQATYTLLKKHDFNAELCPDIALYASKLYDKEQLKLDYFPSTLVNIKDSSYFCFQVGLEKSQRKYRHIAKELIKTYNILKIPLILVSIGNCPGHEDYKALLKIYNILKPFMPVYIFKPENIWEILSVLSNSNFYIGTSLHGQIISQSYQIPFISINRMVQKLTNYLNSWSVSKYKKVLELNKFSRDVNNRLDTSSYNNSLNIQLDVLDKCFDDMLNIII